MLDPILLGLGAIIRESGVLIREPRSSAGENAGQRRQSRIVGIAARDFCVFVAKIDADLISPLGHHRESRFHSARSFRRRPWRLRVASRRVGRLLPSFKRWLDAAAAEGARVI